MGQTGRSGQIAFLKLCCLLSKFFPSWYKSPSDIRVPPRCGKTSISKEEMRARSKFSFASCTFNGNVSAIELEEYQIRRKGHKRKKKHRTNSRQVYHLRMHLDTSRDLRFFCPGFGVDFRKQLVAVLHSGEIFPNLDGTGRRYFN